MWAQSLVAGLHSGSRRSWSRVCIRQKLSQRRRCRPHRCSGIQFGRQRRCDLL